MDLAYVFSSSAAADGPLTG